LLSVKVPPLVLIRTVSKCWYTNDGGDAIEGAKMKQRIQNNKDGITMIDITMMMLMKFKAGSASAA
jgi:hypothetical protein